MKITVSVVVCCIALSGASGALAAGPAIMHGPAAATQEIAAAEKHWTEHMAQVGIAQGMADFLDANEGMSFAGGPPLHAADFKGPRTSETLTWTPTEIFAAKSGDLGASWGQFVDDPGFAGARKVTGRYVTVWKRGSDGVWHALMDIGAPDRK